MNSIRAFAQVFAAATLGASVAQSATFADLSGGGQGSQTMGAGPYSPGPYAVGPYAPIPYGAPPIYGAGPYAPAPPFGGVPSPSGGPEGVPPPALDEPVAATMAPMPASPNPWLPFGQDAELPHGRLQLDAFGQVNSTTDPFNRWGLSTPFMFVPWSTPLSGWTNAQTWNWWRERSGALPRNW
jgi:hypothetical protein